MTLDSHWNHCRISQQRHDKKKKKKKQDLEQISHEMMGMAHGFVVGESELENISGMFVAEIWIGTAEGPT